MRDIKFRGKDIETGEWLYGDLLQSLGHYPQIRSHYCGHQGKVQYERTAVKSDTVGQYIGLKDRAENEAYEGDIVEFYPLVLSEYGSKWQVSPDKHIGLVVYQGAGFAIDVNGTLFCIDNITKGLIIGNLHDNPELLNPVEVTEEMCPYCDSEVELKAELSVQKCPSCGKYIVCCSMCDECVQDCPYEEEAHKLNESGSNNG